jgi:hypothetical protein
MCKPLSSHQVLYFLFTLLSLAFLCLLFASLFLVNSWATEAAGHPHHLALRTLTFECCFNGELQQGQRLGSALGEVTGAIPRGVDRPGPNLDEGSIGPSRPSRSARRSSTRPYEKIAIPTRDRLDGHQCFWVQSACAAGNLHLCALSS